MVIVPINITSNKKQIPTVIQSFTELLSSLSSSADALSLKFNSPLNDSSFVVNKFFSSFVLYFLGDKVVKCVDSSVLNLDLIVGFDSVIL